MGGGMGNGAVGEEFSVESQCSIVVAGLGRSKKQGGGQKEKFPRLGELKNWVWDVKKLYPPN